MAEFQIRGLVRRIDSAEMEIRELSPGGHLTRIGTRGYHDATERAQRLRALRRWLAEDQAKLRALLGVKPA